ncbi:hypothetical protein ACWFR1_32735 [Streptomyces sp. NPDC055103]
MAHKGCPVTGHVPDQVADGLQRDVDRISALMGSRPVLPAASD